MKIGVIGVGVVGSATANAFREHVDEVRCWDGKDERCTHSLHDTVCGSNLVFICLPTPQKINGLGCDTSAIDELFHQMAILSPNTNFVLRSTVPVGYTSRSRKVYSLLNLVHSPEFLTARTADYDAANPARMIIGADQPYDNTTPLTQNPVALHNLYAKVWSKGWDCTDPMDPSYQYPCDPVPIYHMTSDESEFVKLMQNAFSAAKVALFNEFRCFSDKRGLDWERCLAALLAGGWINPQHTNVPGPDGRRGFGGSCLPKDTNNLIACGEDIGVAMIVTQAAMLRNKFDRGEPC